MERISGAVCGCNVAGFFESYVRGAAPIDFARYLQLAGLAMDLEWRKSTAEEKAPDDRAEIYAWTPYGEAAPHIQLMNPENGWGRAGIHTGDKILKFNGAQVNSVAAFRKMLDPLRVGDTIRLEVMHAGSLRETTVTIGAQQIPVVRIRELPEVTARQREVFAHWSKGESRLFRFDHSLWCQVGWFVDPSASSK
jgi:predicted metalloprotease with PDZ domain